MLGVVRRYGVAQALRASAPRSLHVRSTQLLKWQPSSIPKAPSAIRSLHNSTASWSTAAASVQEDFPAQSDIEPLREFIDLRKQGLVDPTVVDTIVRKMKIQTMTDVQSKTLRETLKGGDMYVSVVLIQSSDYLPRQPGPGEDRNGENTRLPYPGTAEPHG